MTLNPVPADIKARVLSTGGIIKEVATVTATWREVAKTSGARSDEINRIASAFEHENLRPALTQ